MVFHWSLSDSKSPQVSRTRLRILAVLSKAVVWMVSTRPPTSKSSRPFNNPLVIVPKAPITISTIVTYYYYYYYRVIGQMSSACQWSGRPGFNSGLAYQRLKKWYLIPPWLTLSIFRFGSNVNWSNPGNGVAPFPAPRCCR